MSEHPFIVMIPARYGSSKLPGKPLIDVNGVPLIGGVIRQAQQSGALRVIVITDNADVKNVAAAAGVEVLAFTGDYATGTDRIAAACDMLGIDDKQLVINMPCDMPMIDPVLLEKLAGELIESFSEVATLGELVDRQHLHTLADPRIVKIVTDDGDRALYFSRAAIPFDRDQASIKSPVLNELYLRHIGVYAFKAATIKQLAEWGPSPLEQMEDIEMLRPLTNGLAVSVLTVRGTGCFSVNSQSELARYRSSTGEPEQQHGQ